jgi:exosome complex component RRP41
MELNKSPGLYSLSMGRIDFISPEGLRMDGRRPNELRNFSSTLSVLPQADGSAAFSLGNTKVIASIFGPKDSYSSFSSTYTTSLSHERGSIVVRVHAAAFSSTSGDKKRSDKRLQEWSDNITVVFSSAIQLELFPRSQIEVFVEVLSADGGVLPACINAVTLALIDAAIPMKDYVVSLSCAFLQEQILLDANRTEERAGGHLTIAVLPRSEMLVGTFSEPKFPQERFEAMAQMIEGGCKQIFQYIDSQIVLPRLKSLFVLLKKPHQQVH